METFEIRGESGDLIVTGALRFDFSILKHLRNIKVEIGGVFYYKLDIPEKKTHDRWINLDTPMEASSADFDDGLDDSDDSDDGWGHSKFYIDLTWSNELVRSVKLLNTRGI